MRKYYPPPAPKPFNFVQLQKPNRKLLGENRHWGHERYETNPDYYTGKLICHLEALSHIHIGSGTFELLNGEVVKGFVRCNGELIIPGSSLKGIIRSVAEAISESCVCKVGRLGRQLLPRVKNRDEDLNECKQRRSTPEEYRLCIACSIFGGIGYQGRVHFEDAVPMEIESDLHKIPSLFSPGRDSQMRKYRDENGKAKGRKFYYHGQMAPGREPYEIIKQHSILQFAMGFKNLHANELCLVLTSMGLIGNKPLHLKIGGGKPACLGTIRIKPKQFSLRNMPQDFCLSYNAEKSFDDIDKINEFLERISGFASLIKNEALNRLSAIWHYPSQKECPSGLY